MRISDWSSDVCSSDLIGCGECQPLTCLDRRAMMAETERDEGHWLSGRKLTVILCQHAPLDGRCVHGHAATRNLLARTMTSAQRRVEKDCVRPCSSPWSPFYYNKTSITRSDLNT